MSSNLTKTKFVSIIHKNKVLKKGRIMLKKTRTRELIKEVLNNSNEPLSANDIFNNLQDKNVTLSSVYRTLDTFYNNNIISKDVSSDGVSKYILIRDEHKHYLECKKCHKSTPLDFCPYHKANAKIKNETDFEVDEHNLIIYGVCKNCNIKNNKK